MQQSVTSLYNNTITKMSASILSKMDRKQNNSSLNSNKSLKYKSHRVLKPADTSNITTFDDRQIAQQLNIEMNKIDQIICQHKIQIEVSKVSRNKNKTVQQQLIDLQEFIRQKDLQIKEINGQIKCLKEAKSKQQLKASKQLLLSPQTFTLAEQLRDQRLQLKELIEIHSQKTTNYRMLNIAVKQIQRVYSDKFPDREINYEAFKQRSQELKRQEQLRSRKKQLRIPSIKQKIQAVFEPSVIGGKVQSESKSMKQLQDKCKKMKLAIKNAKKKHIVEISELTAKLQFLRDEDALLNEQIKQKKQQKGNLQAKFDLNFRNRKRNRGRVSQGISFTHNNIFY